ncbi:hypothetical protein PRIPAC_74779 [Pristionchus pacificus]|uniref:Uncharacterized protein n=1 Tax=Pristionchus pacificus TaxID=54126 RepID=A0A2A6BEP2_PRIPA|nr:hypothetical protein PRIPAC_74779 [Pristionchus pacificus]|eukprot:PDM64326.1 hypothetical protein PRIPAC_52582 [Pristionchus pacificus]
MDTPQTVTENPDSPIGASGFTRKSLCIWALVFLTIALLIGLAVYKRKAIEERWYGKKMVTAHKGSVYQFKRNTVPLAVNSMRKVVAKRNVTTKAKAHGTRTAPHQFAYLPTQGKFVEL